MSLTESEQTVSLEFLKSLLSRKIEDLREEKQRLNHLANIVKEINEKEGKFIELLSNWEKLTEKMYSYFYGNDVCEKVQSIRQDLQQVRYDYEQK